MNTSELTVTSAENIKSYFKYVNDHIKYAYENGSFPNKYDDSLDGFSVTFGKFDGKFKWVCKVFGVNIIGEGNDFGEAVLDFVEKLKNVYGKN